MKIKHILAACFITLSFSQPTLPVQGKNTLQLVRMMATSPIKLAFFVAHQENYNATRSFLVQCKKHISAIIAVLNCAMDERAVW